MICCLIFAINYRMCMETSASAAGGIRSTALLNYRTSAGGNCASCARRGVGSRRARVGSYCMLSMGEVQKRMTKATRLPVLRLGDRFHSPVSRRELEKTRRRPSRPPPLLRRTTTSRKWRSTRRYGRSGNRPCSTRCGRRRTKKKVRCGGSLPDRSTPRKRRPSRRRSATLKKKLKRGSPKNGPRKRRPRRKGDWRSARTRARTRRRRRRRTMMK
mmetsp:Transcript_7664/g.20309  ORF Transcript_7664/g.20309 Transcript_7664/m.20309 type:complete len:215 (-) Transcript_7664:451-1095(-)